MRAPSLQHALINLARIRKGERVLVHSAAGGIGHAAIAICQVPPPAAVVVVVGAVAVGVEEEEEGEDNEMIMAIMMVVNERI